MSKNTDVIGIVAQAFREIGQPNIEGLVFVCDSESVFNNYDKILGIEVYSAPFLNVSGGLLLGSKDYRWNTTGKICVKFQEIMEDLTAGIEED